MNALLCFVFCVFFYDCHLNVDDRTTTDNMFFFERMNCAAEVQTAFILVE
jgi:hypothetical protein